MSLAIGPNNNIYVTAAPAGVFKSSNGGVTWNYLGLVDTYVRGLAVSSSGDIFAGTSSLGLQHSSNGGLTWVSTGLKKYVYCLAIKNNGLLFAGTGNGIFRSNDNGNNWILVNSGLNNTKIWTLAIDSSGTVFAGTDGGGGYRSINDGMDWIPLDSSLTEPLIRSFAFHPNGKRFAGTWGGIYRSSKDNPTWEKLTFPYACMAISITRNGTIIIGSWGSNAFRSTDDGNTWAKIDMVGNYIFHNCIVTDENNITYLGGFGEGIFLSSDDGINWNLTNSSIPNPIWGIDVDSYNNIFSITEGSIIHKSTNYGFSWETIDMNIGPLNEYALSISNNNHLFVGGWWGVARSIDHGVSWSSVGLNDHIISSLCKNKIGYIFAGGDKYDNFDSPSRIVQSNVFRSTDDGDTWQMVSPFNTTNSWYVGADSAGYLYAATTDSVRSLFRSSDNGDTWEEVLSNVKRAYLWSFTSNTLHDIFAIAYGTGVFRSYDNGLHWEYLNNGMTTKLVNALVANRQNHLFAMTDSGVFRSTNNGQMWYPLNDGLKSLIVQCGTADHAGYIYAGMYGIGVYRSKSSTNTGTPYIPYTADFTRDGKIDIRDLSVFAKNWRDGEVSVGDIGPAQGNPPYLSSQHDGKIDFEDLVVFGMMWNWSLENASYTQNKSIVVSTAPTDQISVSFAESTVVGKMETKQFSLLLDRISDIQTASISFEYDSRKIQIDSLIIDNDAKTIVLTKILSEQGRAICDIASLKSSLDERFRKGKFITIRLTAITSLIDEPVRIIVHTYSDALGKDTEVSTVVKFNSKNEIPEQFSLSQNYPNPFNSSSKIRFTIPVETRVTLKVYDLLGYEIETLFDKQCAPGEYHVDWNAVCRPSGLYFYQIKTNNYVDTRKLLLLK